jgi:hypothetical protein
VYEPSAKSAMIGIRLWASRSCPLRRHLPTDWPLAVRRDETPREGRWKREGVLRVVPDRSRGVIS